MDYVFWIFRHASVSRTYPCPLVSQSVSWSHFRISNLWSVMVAQIKKVQKTKSIYYRILLLGGPSPPTSLLQGNKNLLKKLDELIYVTSRLCNLLTNSAWARIAISLGLVSLNCRWKTSASNCLCMNTLWFENNSRQFCLEYLPAKSRIDAIVQEKQKKINSTTPV